MVHGQKFLSNYQEYRLFQITESSNSLSSSAVKIYNKSDFTDSGYHLSWGHSSKITEFLESAQRYLSEKKGRTPRSCKMHLPPSMTAISSWLISSWPSFWYDVP